MGLPCVGWLSLDPVPPGRWDLRHLGWRIARPRTGEADAPGRPALLDWRVGSRPHDWRNIRHPETVLVIGADDPARRARLLASGFGDAVASATSLNEVAARVLRLEAFSRTLPRRRQAGPLVLDIAYRDGRIDGRWLCLGSEEFALLWRLAETPYAPVSRGELAADIWPCERDQAGPALAAVVARVRARLAVCGCGRLLTPAPEGGLQLHAARGTFRAFASVRREPLDRPVAIGNCPSQGHDSGRI